MAIPAILDGKWPQERITYPVDLHIHTVASTHAYSTLSDYIAGVRRKGIKLFVITDHGLDMADAPHHWHFVSVRIRPRVVDGTGILRGIEASTKNIEGETDCSGPVFTSLDLIIAGFHESVLVPHDKDTNTQAIIATMANGNVYTIGCPGGPRYPVDIRAIAQAAVKYQVALEINNSLFLHSRKGSEDNCCAVVTVMCDAGGWVTLGSNSYTAFTLGEFGECRKILDDVSFPEDRILNVTPKRLLAFLESRDIEPIAEFVEL